MEKNILENSGFLLGASEPVHWPDDEGAEVAFAGRSNVGKSSVINRLTGQKSLARTSKTPGRTQQIIFFRVNDCSRLVDLPGYGYARVPLEVRRRWKLHIEAYFMQRNSLRGLVLPVDSRHPVSPLDEQMFRYCLAGGMPTLILLTKADKLSRNQANQALYRLDRHLGQQSWEGLDYTLQLFSAVTGQGEDSARDWILGRLGEID